MAEHTCLSIIYNNRFDVLLTMERRGVNLSVDFPPYFLDLFDRYKRVLEKTRHRAQKKIYFWWLPICYDPRRESGQRMMVQSWEATKALFDAQE
jgi:hypothetical protein